MMRGNPTSPRSLPVTPTYRGSQIAAPMMMGAPSIDTINTINTINTMNSMTTAQFNHATESATQESVIVELTRRLADRDAEIRTLAHQKTALESFVSNQNIPGAGVTIQPEVYDSLLSHCMDREEELRVANGLNRNLDKKLKDLDRLVRDLQSNSANERRAWKEKDEQLAGLAKLKKESALNLDAFLGAQDIIKKKEAVIDYLNKEREQLIAKKKDAAQKEEKLRKEIAGYESLVSKSKTLAEEQINVLLENEASVKKIESVSAKKDKEIESLKEQLKKNAHTIESKDALLNMQRQEMGKQEDLIVMYETKFLAKDMDVPKIVARSDEGERLWSKIEEREKKFAGKQVMVGVLRDQNANLQADKKRLEAEVKELKSSFEMCNLKLGSTGDKVQMNWLLAQLRDTVQMKEKVIELEEIINGEGYTVKAKEAEYDFRKKEIAMALEMEKLTRAVEMLGTQTAKTQDLEVPVLLGKLEECLLIFGYDYDGSEMKPVDDIMSQILTTASSDIMSLNSNNSIDGGNSVGGKDWAESACITTRDFKDLMHPDHFRLITSLAEGFSSLHREGLCNAANHDDIEDDDDDDDDDEDEEAGLFEDRDDIVDATGRGSDDADFAKNTGLSSSSEEEEGGGDGNKHNEGGNKPDLHFEKVLKVIERGEGDPDDWRTWIPPGSPCSACSNNIVTLE